VRAGSRAARHLTLAALTLAAGSALAQTPPPPCQKIVKGKLVSSDSRTMTVDRTGRRDVIPIDPAVVAALREIRAGDGITVEMNCRARPPVAVGVKGEGRGGPVPTPGPHATSQPRNTTVLVSTDDACTLSVDYKPAATLAAGGRTELKLTPGEHMLEAVSADGRTWKEKVKVGSDQLIVEVKLGQPAATVAQYDAQAARVCGALGALKAAGQELDVILRNSRYKFHKADSAAVSTAVASWTRELATLKAMVAPAPRARVADDLSRIDADVREYAELLVKALETAQEKNTIMGEAGTLRDKATARRPLLKLPAETVALLPACGV
jgi:hypothetical protein